MALVIDIPSRHCYYIPLLSYALYRRRCVVATLYIQYLTQPLIENVISIPQSMNLPLNHRKNRLFVIT